MHHLMNILTLLAFSLSLIGCFVDEGAQTLPMIDDDGELLEIRDDSEHPIGFVESEGDPSNSATTQYRSIRNAYSGALMEEAWYNPADANLSKGRNSFTIKDWGCNNGYDARIYWTGARSGSRTQSCGESSFSIEPNNVAYAAISWRLCVVDRFIGEVACTPWVSSYID